MKHILTLLVALLLPHTTLHAADNAAGTIRRAESTKVLIGAIRWDAWQENSHVQVAAEKSLSPSHWHDRLPYFAKVTGPNSVVINGNSQAIMDQEINYAADAGIDYWAFCIYPEAFGMSRGLQLYRSSSIKSRINFAINLQGGWIANETEDWDAQLTRYVGYFKDPSYQKVLGNRPLVYLFTPVDTTLRFPNAAAVAAAIHQLRAATTNAGLGSPYIVWQGWDASADFKIMHEYGLDAIGAYAVGWGSVNGEPYADLAAAAHRFWESGKATGANVVPIVTSGWNNKPRYENPAPWAEGSPEYNLPPTPPELADHLADALDWTRVNHAAATPANTVLIYAWNEHDEGGWLCPTLNPDGSINNDRLAAIAAKLKTKADQ